ncbi:hypothetical protein NPIL_243311 [Nephila pilipes]|uniref:Uncharacterized protein n=1 Tax=Nephila pilipes TaxID=299642 RepID=A0A8X6U452_NEPPI|nr:hypothetical protein NPIL_243311 [Nephila pilipes]
MSPAFINPSHLQRFYLYSRDFKCFNVLFEETMQKRQSRLYGKNDSNMNYCSCRRWNSYNNEVIHPECCGYRCGPAYTGKVTDVEICLSIVCSNKGLIKNECKCNFEGN